MARRGRTLGGPLGSRRVDPESATVTWEGGIRLDPDILYQDLAARGAR
jgi:hypothetical protein